jgi:hypothetical protein
MLPGVLPQEIEERLKEGCFVVVHDILSPVNVQDVVEALKPEKPFGTPFYVRVPFPQESWELAAEFQTGIVEEAFSGRSGGWRAGLPGRTSGPVPGEIGQCFVGQGLDGPLRMIGGDSLFQINKGQHAHLGSRRPRIASPSVLTSLLFYTPMLGRWGFHGCFYAVCEVRASKRMATRRLGDVACALGKNRASNLDPQIMAAASRIETMFLAVSLSGRRSTERGNAWCSVENRYITPTN